MNDMIRKSALLSDIEESIVFSGRSGETSAEIRGAHKVVDRIKAAPAVDAVEVKHGYWDDSGRYKFANGETAIMCSKCGCCLHEDEYKSYYWNYCPCCGSRMDGERRSE